MSKLQIADYRLKAPLIAGLLAICFLLFPNFSLFAQEEKEAVKMKRAVLIIPERNFRDEELLETKQVLERKTIEVKIASTTLGEVKGMLGAKVKPDMLVSDIKVEDFSAIVFIGGEGASQYWDDPTAHRLAREAVSEKKILAAICIAPVTLAKAGVLEGKRATVSYSESGRLMGSKYLGHPVEKDGNIITASGPTVTKDFAKEIADTILQ